MTYTTEQRDAFIAQVRQGPVHYCRARDKAGLTEAVAGEILAKGHSAGMIGIVDIGPGERGMLVWRGE